MSKQAHISTKEAAERLHVHARTVRKWIDTFEEYISPEVNDRGHYMLTQEGYHRLTDIQKRLHKTGKSMRQIRQDLLKEGKLEPEQSDEPEVKEEPKPALPFGKEYPVYRIIGSLDEIGEMMETVFSRLDQLEDHVFTIFEGMEELESKVSATQNHTLPLSAIQKKMEEVVKKQDQLKVELRNATFSHRLASATQEGPYVSRRQKKARFLGIF
ncbi:MerR family transcriptional regulator [Kroppenstedtia pulmonis]|uniref:MerR family transcriptional regulator n=1 Tax=Kroppenstedtia pulmonis TaxID=1380685 RepID=A0A7D3Y0K8_9BACL|nr:MerR family transcriptional regulator [Kroppenstedtia pulmonis]QKG83723.1 MerR family transcriptional regulator [Kroppenstedtia pulmonis]